METKFTALNTIASIFKIIGMITAILTLLVVIGICATSILGGAALDSFSRDFGGSGTPGIFSGIIGGLLISFFVIINGGGLALSFFAMGEVIFVLLSLEENTRATVDLLRGQPDVEPENIFKI